MRRTAVSHCGDIVLLTQIGVEARSSEDVIFRGFRQHAVHANLLPHFGSCLFLQSPMASPLENDDEGVSLETRCLMMCCG